MNISRRHFIEELGFVVAACSMGFTDSELTVLEKEKSVINRLRSTSNNISDYTLSDGGSYKIYELEIKEGEIRLFSIHARDDFFAIINYKDGASSYVDVAVRNERGALTDVDCKVDYAFKNTVWLGQEEKTELIEDIKNLMKDPNYKPKHSLSNSHDQREFEKLVNTAYEKIIT